MCARLGWLLPLPLLPFVGACCYQTARQLSRKREQRGSIKRPAGRAQRIFNCYKDREPSNRLLMASSPGLSRTSKRAVINGSAGRTVGSDQGRLVGKDASLCPIARFLYAPQRRADPFCWPPSEFRKRDGRRTWKPLRAGALPKPELRPMLRVAYQSCETDPRCSVEVAPSPVR